MIYIPKNKRRVLFEKRNCGKEEMFLYLTEDLVCKTHLDMYPNSIFLFKNDLVYFEILNKQDEKNEHMHCSYPHYWSVFEGEFGINYIEIQSFTKKMVEKHFKIKDLTPRAKFGKFNKAVEKHFKMKDLTPMSTQYQTFSGVEKHFNFNKV